MVDTITDPEFAHALIEKILTVQIEMYGYLLDQVGEYIDIVECRRRLRQPAKPAYITGCIQGVYLPGQKEAESGNQAEGAAGEDLSAQLAELLLILLKI